MSFVEKLTFLSSLAALISALAALVTAIAQVFIARSSSLYTYSLETEKLFLHAKVEAYQAFLEAADKCMKLTTSANTENLLSRCSYAILFSEDATCAKLSALSAALMEFRSSPDSSHAVKKLQSTEYEAVEAMRQELLQSRYPLRKHKQKI